MLYLELTKQSKLVRHCDFRIVYKRKKKEKYLGRRHDLERKNEETIEKIKKKCKERRKEKGKRNE